MSARIGRRLLIFPQWRTQPVTVELPPEPPPSFNPIVHAYFQVVNTTGGADSG